MKVKGYLLAAAVGLSVACAAEGAIIVGNATTDFDNNGDLVIPSHTVADNPDRLLVVTVAGEGAELTTMPVAGVMFGTQSLARAVSFRAATTGSNKEYAEVWYLFAPDVGSAAVSVDVNYTSGDGYSVMVHDFGNIDQSGFVDTDGRATETHATGFTLNFDLSTVSTGALLIGTADKNNTTTPLPAPSTGVSVFTDTTSDSATGAGYKILGSGEVGGNAAWAWTWQDNDHAIAGVAFAEVPEPTSLAIVAGGALMLLARRRSPRPAL